MNNRQMNVVNGIVRGLVAAREDLNDPTGLTHAMEIIRTFCLTDEPVSMSMARSAYLACCLMVWRDAGCPPLE